ncbi:MAG: ABC transporter permease [Candidatus Cloacimonetes bacterium]|nr:ABC transporter permease [Candidatus Cloacimonadota bacterium]
MNPVSSLIVWSRREMNGFLEFIHFTAETWRRLLTYTRQRQASFTVLLRQIMFTGYEALGLISFLALTIGGLIILQGNNILGNFGQGDLIYVILVTVVVRELSSILTALIVIARSGTAISTELGNMVVNQEIDLLLSFGISPVSYLVVSRLVGVVVATFTLTIYFNLVALLGGWLFSSFFSPINFNFFFSRLFAELSFLDILISVFKSMVFGIGIALISCYQGLKVNIASTEVPQRTIRAVVLSIVFVLFADILITLMFYIS